MRQRHQQNGFTIIELLVVITIIVVLLALLTPALDKAIYHAELATCMARLHGIHIAASSYGGDNKRFYPTRIRFSGNDKPFHLTRAGWDYRPQLRPYITANHFIDPLAGDVDFSDPAITVIEMPYSLWFGMAYPGEKGIRKLGDLLHFDPALHANQYANHQGAVRLNILASDTDLVDDSGGFAHSGHPDKSGILQLREIDREAVTESVTGIEGVQAGDIVSATWWTSINTGGRRGASDLHTAYQDGSVFRLSDATYDDGRMVRLPEAPSTTGSRSTRWINVAPR